MEKPPTNNSPEFRKEKGKESLDIKNLNYNEIAKSLDKKFGINVRSSNEIKSLKTTEENVFLILEERGSKSIPGYVEAGFGQSSNFIILDKNLKETFRKSSEFFEKFYYTVAPSLWGSGTRVAELSKPTFSYKPKSEFKKILSIKGGVAEILNANNEVIEIKIPDNIVTQDCPSGFVDSEFKQEKLKNILENVNFIDDISFTGKTGDDYIEEINKSKTAKLHRSLNSVPSYSTEEIENFLKQIEPSTEKVKVVSLKLKELGLSSHHSNYDQIIERAEDVGLNVCTVGVVPEIAINKKMDSILHVTLKPLEEKSLLIHPSDDGRNAISLDHISHLDDQKNRIEQFDTFDGDDDFLFTLKESI